MHLSLEYKNYTRTIDDANHFKIECIIFLEEESKIDQELTSESYYYIFLFRRTLRRQPSIRVDVLS